MSKIGKYLKSKKPGWYITNGLLAIVIALLLVPSWREAVNVMMIRMFTGKPPLTEKSIPIPEEAYEWEIIDLNTAEWWKFEETRGQVVFLNHWATWCGPCVAEMKSIQELYDSYGDRVRFILISREEPKVIKKFKDRKGYDLPFCSVLDAPPVFQSRKFPTTYIINKKGEIVVKEFGAHDWNDKNVRNLLDELLKE